MLAFTASTIIKKFYPTITQSSARISSTKGSHMECEPSAFPTCKYGLHTNKSPSSMVFTQYLGIFSKVTVNTSLRLLETYASPAAFIEADKQEIIDIIRPTARFGLIYARNKYNAVIQAAAVARRIIHTLALQSISTSRTGEAKNLVLRNYYLKKYESKPKLVAMGAVSHKVCNMIFAILRDNKPFETINPDDHIKQYNAAKCDKAA